MKHTMRNTMLLVVLLMVPVAGCGRAAISGELRTARSTLSEARAGNAARYEPDQVRAAERTLARAEAAPDGSVVERDLAYVADRQARIAIVDARRISNEELVATQERMYQDQLERVARDREQQLSAQQTELEAVRADLGRVRGQLAERGQALDARSAELAETERTLAAREQELLDAERRASDAMSRLAELANVRQEQERTIITISGEVLFETGRAQLRANARERLRAVADALRGHEGAQITVEGHTDARGSDDDNATLSQQRAEAVRQFLLGEGVPEDRLRAVGRGEADPIADNRTAEGRAENRRVEIEISPPDARVSVR
jgi:outer membrane protein OmpA-like peptidoglycan-associated protein